MHPPRVGYPCQHPDLCVVAETCDAQGNCSGTPRICPDEQCRENEMCVNGICESSASPGGTACDDGIVCTRDTCDGQGNCVGVVSFSPDEVGTFTWQFTSPSYALTWGPVVCADLYNLYWGVIPAALLGSRGKCGNPQVYDHICYQGGIQSSGLSMSTAPNPTLGTAYYFLVNAENRFGEGILGYNTCTPPYEIPLLSPC